MSGVPDLATLRVRGLLQCWTPWQVEGALMIKAANEYPVHTLRGHERKGLDRTPLRQREYPWYKAHWEDLLEDLIDGAHLLGTIITLDQTVDTIEGNTVHVVDGKQRQTTLLLAVFKQHIDELREGVRTGCLAGSPLAARSD